MTQFNRRQDIAAWIFGIAVGNVCGYVMALLCLSSFGQRLRDAAPGTVVGFDIATLASLVVLVFALFVVPPVTISLARHRTVAWPFLPLASFFGWVILGNPSQTVSSDLGGMAPLAVGVCIFASLAWLPFSRTVLFFGRQTLRDDLSCAPRSLWLLCQILGLRTTVNQARALTASYGNATPISKIVEAAAALGVILHAEPNADCGLHPAYLPALAIVKRDAGSVYHAIVLLEHHGQRILIHDPNDAWEKWIPADTLRHELAMPVFYASRRPGKPPSDERTSGRLLHGNR